MDLLNSKRILLIVTGGVAAYKAPEIVRRLRAAGADVRVAMTEAALEFVTELTFHAVSGNEVYTSLFIGETESGMGHIELARWSDVIVVAPASADFVARLAGGRADDLASTICLAASSSILIAPAMNQQMWNSAATQENISKLEERNFLIHGPMSGDQACGEVGPGRLAEPDSFVGVIADIFKTGILRGVRILVTAGPTHEPIDPVRYVANRSTGSMGYSIVSAALEMGASVTLVSGPSNLSAPSGARIVNVSTAQEMFSATLKEAEKGQDIFIGTAAVADYTPESKESQKIKKGKEKLELKMVSTQDILLAVANLQERPFTVGFAAETDNLEKNAKSKLVDKHLDMIAANLVGVSGVGFGAEDNELLVFFGKEKSLIVKASKPKVARSLLTLISDKYFENKN